MTMRKALLSVLVLPFATLALAADPGTTTTVPVSGTVSGGAESVVFSGQATVNSRLAPDPDFGKHKVVLTVDLSGVAGVGASSQAKYVIPGPDIMQRRLAASDVISLTFPFLPDGGTVLSARSGVATFALSFDLNTGAVTAASASVSASSY